MTRSPLVGKPAPPLELPDANGETYKLEPDKAGVPIALFFYPKSGVYPSMPLLALWRAHLNLSGSYGCTKEACEFRDALTGALHSLE